uniref:Uncharacterized protein n=1 Tax=Ditylenchus dipsaci TaxID=166011 RepID=A0A915D6W1_9BILA
MEIEDVEPESPPVTIREANEYLKGVQRFLDRNPSATMQRMCDGMDDFLVEKRMEKLRQKNILEYFAPDP